MFEAGKMGKRNDLRDFDKGQIVMASWLDQSISKITSLVGSSRYAVEWFEKHDKEFKVLSWPPNSTDLNPIEHLWDLLEKQIQSMETTPHNSQALKDLLLMSWCQIPEYTFRGLLESVHREIKAIVVAWGGPTQY